jgi:hypothetical protein
MLTNRGWIALGSLALGVGLLTMACGPRKSGENQSCEITDHCEDGLVCIAGVCATEAAAGLGGGPGDPSSRVISGRNESCQTRVDCEPGLSCVQGTCVVPDAPFTPTGQECFAEQCITHRDCCQPPTSFTCTTAKEGCDGGDLSDCNYYEYYCNCTDAPAAPGTTGWECTADNECVFHKTCDAAGLGSDCFSTPGDENICTAAGTCVECESDADCFDGTCNPSGRCVECATSEDCGGQTCTAEGTCVADRECWTDSDCLGNDACTAEGKCEERPCVSDRQCAEQFDSYEATCGADGECQVPCDFDSECNPGGRYAGYICHESMCARAGCESDAECQALNGGLGALVYQCRTPE